MRGKRFLQNFCIAKILILMGLITMPWNPPVWAADKPQSSHKPFRYDPQGRRDPFAPLVINGRLVGPKDTVHGQGDTPVLYGILWDPGGKSLALINDGEVGVGDTVGDYKVLEIRRDAVVLSDGGEPVVLQITFEAPPPKLSPHTTTGGAAR